MTAEIIPFDRARALRRRESGRVAASPLFFACCCTPFGLAWLIGLALAEASLNSWGRR